MEVPKYLLGRRTANTLEKEQDMGPSAEMQVSKKNKLKLLQRSFQPTQMQQHGSSMTV